MFEPGVILNVPLSTCC